MERGRKGLEGTGGTSGRRSAGSEVNDANRLEGFEAGPVHACRENRHPRDRAPAFLVTASGLRLILLGGFQADNALG
jgi:hypothetical protein